MGKELEVLATTTGEDTIADDEATKRLSDGNAVVLLINASLELTVISGELVVSALLETVSKEDITAGDKASTELAEGVLCAIARLEFISMDNGVVISVLVVTASDNDIPVEDRKTTELSKNNAAVRLTPRLLEASADVPSDE